MAITVNDSISTHAPKPLDDRYFNNLLPWADVAAANAGIPSTYRHKWLTVNIAGVEYRYANGVTDGDLVVKTGTGSWSWVSTSNEVVLNVNDSAIPWKQYRTFADIYAYVASQTPSATNTRASKFSWYITEDIVVQEYNTIVGTDTVTSILDWDVTLESPWSQYLATNNIMNVTLRNLILWGPLTPITFTFSRLQNYAPWTITYSFSATPTTGTYTLTLDGETTTAINYNDDAATVGWIIVASLSSKFAWVTVAGSYTAWFTINMIWFGYNLTAVTNSGTNVDMDVGITITSASHTGTYEQQLTVFSWTASQWDFYLEFVYNSITYTSTILHRNSVQWDITLAIKAIFQDILVAEGVDLWQNDVHCQFGSYGGFNRIMGIRPGNYPWVAPQFTIVSSTLEWNESQYFWLDNVRIEWASGVWNNGWFIRNSMLLWGDLSSVGIYLLLDKWFSVALDPTNPIKLSANLLCNWHDFIVQAPWGLELNGWQFSGGWISWAANIVWKAWSYWFSNTFIDAGFTIPTGTTMVLREWSYVNGVITIASGAQLIWGIKNLAYQPVIQSGWSFIQTDIHFGSGSPVWVVTPIGVGDKYQDFLTGIIYYSTSRSNLSRTT